MEICATITTNGAVEIALRSAPSDLATAPYVIAPDRVATGIWGAVLYDVLGDKTYQAPLREDISIADRTGGDSFASGVLAALLKGKDLGTTVQWGAAHGILVQEMPGDTTLIEQKLVEQEVKRAASKGGVRATR